jgi:predicted Zn-ribbon and HTH transcriptional regulator
MFRKGLITLLRDNPMVLAEIARLMEMTQKDVEDDLRHLMKSLKHSEFQLIITPAKCRKCGFKFNKKNYTSRVSVPNVMVRGLVNPCLRSERA